MTVQRATQEATYPDGGDKAAAMGAADASVPAAGFRLPGLWLGLSLAAAGIAAAASVTGLLVSARIYGQETAAFADAAAAQDMVNLAIVVPLIVVLAILARSGSVRAYVCWLGCLAFTTYNYAIYAFSIHFGPLFLPWVAVLGLSFYALVGGLAAADAPAVKDRVAQRGGRLAGWTLIAFAALFSLLWLSEIVPDLLAGNPSRSAATWRVPTNPVHVLDLALFLPAVAASGVLLLRRKALGYLTAPGSLVFLALTCLPILVIPAVAQVRGHEPGWSITLPIGVVLVTATTVLTHLFGRARRTATSHAGEATS
jgi:hypothetical protein